MKYHSHPENLDEDGYTQLDFRTRGIPKRPKESEKESCLLNEQVEFQGMNNVQIYRVACEPVIEEYTDGSQASSPPWRPIVVALGILCLVALVIASVLGVLAFWRFYSGRNPEEKENFPSRNKENHKPTKSSLDEKVAPSKASQTTGHFSGPCPHNWVIHEKSCYLFKMSQNSWAGSKRHCSQLGAHLLKIDNSKEFEFIESQTSSHHINSFWVGLSRNQTEGPWLWEDGSPFIPNSFQVRDTASQESLLHNCVWIHGSEVFNQICNIAAFSICEKQL